MNKRLFWLTTIIVIVVMTVSVFISGSLDEISGENTSLQIVDAINGHILRVLGFIFGILHLMKVPSSTGHDGWILIVGIIVSGFAWGLIVERSMCLLKRRKQRGVEPTGTDYRVSRSV